MQRSSHMHRLWIAAPLAACAFLLLACAPPAAAPAAGPQPSTSSEEAAADEAAAPPADQDAWGRDYPIFTQGEGWNTQLLNDLVALEQNLASSAPGSLNIPVPAKMLSNTVLTDAVANYALQTAPDLAPFNLDIFSRDLADLFWLDWPTTYLDPDRGALVQFLALRSDNDVYSLFERWAIWSAEQGRPGSIIAGAWVVHQPTEISVRDVGLTTLDKGQYALLLYQDGNNLRFSLVGEQRPVIEGSWVLRSRTGNGTFVYLSRKETCFVLSGDQACLLIELPGFDSKAGLVETAAQELIDAGILPGDGTVNTQDVFATIYDLTRRQECAAALQEENPESCQPDAVAAAIEPALTAPGPIADPPPGFTNVVWSIGLLAVITDIDNGGMSSIVLDANGGYATLPKGAYRLDLIERPAESTNRLESAQIVQLVSQESAVYYAGAHRLRSYVGEIVEPSSAAGDEFEYRVLYDGPVWSYCSPDNGYVSCRSGEWKWLVCAIDCNS